MNFRDEDTDGLSFSVFFLREGPPGAPVLLIDPDFELKMEELNEVSAAPNDKWPLWDVSCGGYPTAPSWWGGGNFSLLLLAFPFVTFLHLWRTELDINKLIGYEKIEM